MDGAASTDFDFDIAQEKCRRETNESFHILNDALAIKNDASISRLFDNAFAIEKRLEELLGETNSLINSVQNEVDSLPDCSNGLLLLHEQLKNNEFAAEKLSIPSKLHVSMKQFDVLSASDDICALTSLICEMESLINALESMDDSVIEKLLPPLVIQAAKYDFVTKKELTITNVTEKWASFVRWSFAEEGETKVVTLSIDDAVTVKAVMDCLHRLKCLQGKLKVFVGNILEYFVQPIVVGKNCAVSVSGHEICVKSQTKALGTSGAVGVFGTFESPTAHAVGGTSGAHAVSGTSGAHAVAGTSGAHATAGTCADPSVESIFENLEILFKGIAALLNLKSVDVNDEEFTIKLIDLELADLLMNLIADELIKPTISPLAANLRKYEDRVNLCKKFQKSMESFGFRNFAKSNIENRVGDVENLITNSKCCNGLEDAREFIKSPLHETKFFEENFFDFELLERFGFGKIDEIETILRSELRLSDETNLPDLLRFPSCHISCGILKLVELIESLLNASTTVSNFEESAKLLETCRYIFELFLAVAQLHHAESLKQLPRNAAVFFNNCMYLSHRAATLGLEYSAAAVGAGKRQCRVSFVDFVPLLRNLGSSTLREQLNQQIAVLDDYLKSCQGFAGLTMNMQTFDKGLKQCILHLKRMFTVWNEVLPIGIRYRLLAVLTNHVLESCSKMTLKLEDIPESDAEALYVAFENLLREATQLFQGVGEKKSNAAPQFCQPHFQRLEELQKLLKANLLAIDDRFAGGRGPLAIFFDPEDVKHLIRALFQNTERRAAVLSRIHRAN